MNDGKDRRSLNELIAASAASKLTELERDDIHQCEVFLAELVMRRRVPLTDAERRAIAEFAKTARAPRDDFGYNPHQVKSSCSCGNCKAGV